VTVDALAHRKDSRLRIGRDLGDLLVRFREEPEPASGLFSAPYFMITYRDHEAAVSAGGVGVRASDAARSPQPIHRFSTLLNSPTKRFQESAAHNSSVDVNIVRLGSLKRISMRLFRSRSSRPSRTPAPRASHAG
jgi:hypothetical protein